MKEGISVVITSFNERCYLEQAIRSVINQTKPPLEIIVCDDGSTDDSQSLIERFSKTYPGFILPVLHENLGIPKNRNTGIAVAQGKYISFLDGDDLFLPHKLEFQEQALKTNNHGVTYSNFMRVGRHREPISPRYNCEQKSGELFWEVAALNYGITRTMLVETELVRTLGGFDENLPKYDGFWLTVQLSRLTTFAYIDDVLMMKRQHEDGDSQKNLDQDKKDLSLIYSRIRKLDSHHDSHRWTQLNQVWSARLPNLR